MCRSFTLIPTALLETGNSISNLWWFKWFMCKSIQRDSQHLEWQHILDISEYLPPTCKVQHSN